MEFEPCLWEAADEPRRIDEASGRVRQVWFPGVHSDVGGGYPVCGLSDTTLLWMTTEARARGLVFDQHLLDVYVECGKPAEPNDSLTTAYRVMNAVSEAHMRSTRGTRRFTHGWRRLDPPPTLERDERAIGVRIASTAARKFREDPDYQHPNLLEFAERTAAFSGWEQEVVPLPRSVLPSQRTPEEAPAETPTPSETV
jgi:hypothetical protein